MCDATRCGDCGAALDAEEMATCRASRMQPQCYGCMERTGDAAEAGAAMDDWVREARAAATRRGV